MNYVVRVLFLILILRSLGTSLINVRSTEKIFFLICNSNMLSVLLKLKGCLLDASTPLRHPARQRTILIYLLYEYLINIVEIVK